MAGVRRIEIGAGAGERPGQLFEQWEAGLSEAYVPLAVSPRGSEQFRGWLVWGQYRDVDLSTIGSSGQRVDRTKSLIARTDDEILLASIQLSGRGRLYQDDRVAEIGAGEMVFYDSTRPYRWEFDDDWEMAVVQAPLSRLRERAGLTSREIPVASVITRDSPAGMVSRFLLELADLQNKEPEQAAALSLSAVDLLVSAIALTSGRAVPGEVAPTLTVRQVVEFLRRHHTEAGLTVDAVAAGCGVSRRTLYRVLEQFEGGPAVLLRQIRLEHARRLLTARPDLPVSAVARAAGFSTERQFFRAFRGESGMTPAAYRATGGERA
ncbi:helix-turn-helix domain-containing protein [Nocardia sp. NPDC059240]|uniref:helix-turn-helix domain-containing protein n=1 Tax=Nocardia sp. NPDC059240 TaxID=3346786 RepID=UPI00369DE6BE